MPEIFLIYKNSFSRKSQLIKMNGWFKVYIYYVNSDMQCSALDDLTWTQYYENQG